MEVRSTHLFAVVWLPPLLLALMATLLFLGRLDTPFLEPQEARYAEIPRQMLAESSLLVPVLHGQPYLDKPPLFYWLVAGVYRVLGVHDWAARLVPGVLGVLTVLCTWGWGKRAMGARAGFLAGMVLCLAPRFVYLGRMVSMDALLACTVTASLAAAFVAVAAPKLHWRWWLASAVAAGLGLLAKGPVAIVLLVGPLVLLRLFDRRGARISVVAWLLLLAVPALLAVPWYVALSRSQPDFGDTFFWKHNVARFLEPFDHQEPAWFYLPGLVLGMMPWMLLSPGLVVLLARRGRANVPLGVSFALLAFAFGFAFFSAAGCKRPAYLLPTLPPLALAFGWRLDSLIARSDWAALWQTRAASARWLALATALGVAVVFSAAAATRMIEPRVAVPLGVAFVAAAMIVALRSEVSWATGGGIIAVSLVLGVLLLQPAYNRRFALREDLARHVRAAVEQDVPILCFPYRWDSISFYYPAARVRSYARNQRVQLLADLAAQPEALLVVRSGRPLDELARDLPADVQFAEIRPSGLVAFGRTRAAARVTDAARSRSSR